MTNSGKWRIELTKQPTKFQGLGNLKDTLLPVGVPVILDDTSTIKAVPAISGSQKSSSDYKDTTFVFETARFEQEMVARASFKLGYRSDASKAFIAGTSPLLQKLTLIKLAENLPTDSKLRLISNWKGEEDEEFSIKVNLEYIANKLDERGLEYWKEIIVNKLQFLGVFDSSTNILYPNPFYSHIQNQDDLLEEVIRLIGFTNLNPSKISASLEVPDTNSYEMSEKFKDVLASAGFSEVITRPFLEEEYIEEVAKAFKLLNPINSKQPYFRTSLLTTLLRSIERNIVQGIKSPRIFEINKVYIKSEDGLKELIQLGFVYTSPDPYLGTTVINAINKLNGLSNIATTTIDNENGRNLIWGENEANLIQVSNKLKKEMNLPLNKNVWVGLIKLDNEISKELIDLKSYYDLSAYPAITRSYSIIVDTTKTWTSIKNQLLTGLAEGVITYLEPIERLKVDASKEKLNFKATFFSYERTLEGQEIEDWEKKILSQI